MCVCVCVCVWTFRQDPYRFLSQAACQNGIKPSCPRATGIFPLQSKPLIWCSMSTVRIILFRIGLSHKIMENTNQTWIPKSCDETNSTYLNIWVLLYSMYFWGDETSKKGAGCARLETPDFKPLFCFKAEGVPGRPGFFFHISSVQDPSLISLYWLVYYRDSSIGLV